MSALVFAFCGDIIWSRHVDALARRKGADYLFEAVASHLRRADVVVANLEGCISRRGTPMPKQYTFRAPPALAHALAKAGVHLVTMGNNHTMDYGATALMDTFQHLEQARVLWAGAGPNAESAGSAVYIYYPRFSVAIVSFSAILPKGFPATSRTPGVATLEHVIPAIVEARQKTNVVIVVPHWGEERQHTPSAKQRRVARLLARMGVDLVVGHHPHVVQNYECIGRTHVLYSVGNLVHTPASDAGKRGAVLLAEVTARGVEDLRVLPIWIESGQPIAAPRSQARVIADLVEPLPVAG